MISYKLFFIPLLVLCGERSRLWHVLRVFKYYLLANNQGKQSDKLHTLAHTRRHTRTHTQSDSLLHYANLRQTFRQIWQLSMFFQDFFCATRISGGSNTHTHTSRLTHTHMSVCACKFIFIQFDCLLYNAKFEGLQAYEFCSLCVWKCVSVCALW